MMRFRVNSIPGLSLEFMEGKELILIKMKIQRDWINGMNYKGGTSAGFKSFWR